MHPDLSIYSVRIPSKTDDPAGMPSHWREMRFRFLFSFGKGLNVTKENMQEVGVPCLTYGDVHSKFGFEFDPRRDQLKCVSPVFLSTNPSSLLSVGDFVFADTSEDIAGSGNFSQLINDSEVFAGYHTVIARPVGKNVPRFLAYFFDSSAFREQVRESVKGVKVYSITKGILKNIRVWLPELLEQELIASYLDKKVEVLDRAIRLKEKQITLLRERKQILIQNALIRGLNQDVPMRDSGVEWIGKIPEHWELLKLKFLFREVNERTRTGQETLFSLRMDKGLVPHDEVSDKYIADENLVDYKVVHPGQMVMNRMRAAIGIFGLSQRHGLVSPDYAIFDIGSRANPKFFLKLFKLPLLGTQFRLNSKGLGTGSSGFMRLYTENFGDIKVALPPIGEQVDIVDFIQAESTKIEKATGLLSQQITKLKEYKATLVNSAVTGRIKVPGVVEPEGKEEVPV